MQTEKKREKRTTPRTKKASQIAAAVGCCERTVRNWWAQPRAEYLANSITQSKPWEAIGMSRRSWYRHGKPTENPRDSAGAKKNTSSSTGSQPG